MPSREVIEQVVRIQDGHVAQAQRSDARIEIGFDGVVRGRDHPEQPIRGDSPTVIMNLIGGTDRGQLPRVDVESDEHKGAVVVFAVFPDVHALHAAHVRPKRQRPGGIGAREGDARPRA